LVAHDEELNVFAAKSVSDVVVVLNNSTFEMFTVLVVKLFALAKVARNCAAVLPLLLYVTATRCVLAMISPLKVVSPAAGAPPVPKAT
jgi:hypothetical protein